MFSKTITSVLLFVILFASLSVDLAGQSAQSKQEKKVADVKAKIKKLGLGEAAKIKIRLYNNTSYQGFVKEVNDDGFVLVDGSGNSNAINYSDVDSVDGESVLAKHKLALGVTIGVIATVGIIFLAFKASGKRL